MALGRKMPIAERRGRRDEACLKAVSSTARQERPCRLLILPAIWTLVLASLSTFFVLSETRTSSGPNLPLTGQGPLLVSLRILPQQVTLWGDGASHRVLVLGSYDDGLERDVTLESTFSISDPGVAAIQSGARLIALSDGEAVLRAEFEGQIAATRVHIADSDRTRFFSFERNIGRILTKHGCNGSECHGALKGKGGFKLSLNGRFPSHDYRWIVEGQRYEGLTPASGPNNPRVNVEEPGKSLLLLKPTMSLPHGGGQRFDNASSDYQTILDWVRSRAPYGEHGEVEGLRIKALEVLPEQVVLQTQDQQQLLVIAHLFNGQREDITDQVRYSSNNSEILEVTSRGLVKAVRRGETVVIVRAPGGSASARFGVINQPVSRFTAVAPKNFIDDYIYSKLRKFHITPSGLSSDAEFLRRACLDITGTLPLPQRVREFLASQDPEKRDRLIETLLDSPEYIDYWTFRFADFLRVMWSNASTYKTWIRNSLAANKPFDVMARERVSAQGVSGAARHYFKRTGEVLRPEDVMTEDARAFLGLRLDCAQCHNHPYEGWTQEQFWGMAAFYGGASRVRDFGIVFDDPAGHGERRDPRVVHPRTQKEVQPRFLDGITLSEEERADPRLRLGEWMTRSSNPQFSKVIVNRIWAHFFGRGIVDSVDDFRATNPPTHIDLLEALAKDFRENGYDLKHLMRLILQSRTYQVSGDSNESNQEDRINYARALPRRLDAEILLDAISRVTEVNEVFVIHHYVGGGVELPGTRAIHLTPEISPSHFLDVYGRPPLRETIPIRDPQAKLGQALHMLAGPAYTSKISKAAGRLDRLLKGDASDEQIIEELYLAALSRFPTDRELAKVETAIRQLASRRKAIEALAWGLIASREFTYNH